MYQNQELKLINYTNPSEAFLNSLNVTTFKLITIEDMKKEFDAIRALTPLPIPMELFIQPTNSGHIEMKNILMIALVKQNPWSLAHIDDKDKTYNMCLEAAKHAKRRIYHNDSILKYIPKELITKEICLYAVEGNGQALSDVPIELRDFQVCLTAVKKYGEALADVPENLRTEEICIAAVSEFGFSIKYVPCEYITLELCYSAVNTAPLALQWIPDKYKTFEVCQRAVMRNSHAIDYIPKNMQDLIFYGYTKN